MHTSRLDENELSEIEIIAHTARLIINGRMALHLAAGGGVSVAVNEGGIAVGRHTEKSLESILSQYERRGLGAQQYVFGTSGIVYFS